jgi:hypothetical protein
MGLSTHFLQFDPPAFFLLVQNPKSTILQKKLLQKPFSSALKNWVLGSPQDFLWKAQHNAKKDIGVVESAYLLCDFLR